jgi:hypothetical protein
MKINKQLLESTPEDGILDPADSVTEIADEVINSTVEATEGEVVLGDAAAKEIASEVKKVDTEIGLAGAAVDADDDMYIGVKNIITDTLDMALVSSLKNKRRGAKFGSNVLIIGLPGSGKTASVEDWAKTNNINLVSINAKNNDLDAYINGYTTKDPDDPHWTTQAFSKNLMALEEPRSVLFIDEYNRQIKQQIRASLLTLINEHRVVGDGPRGQHEFKNLLFTIAVINPAVPTDKGAAALIDAEKTRFVFKLKDMDSDPATTIEFLTKYYNKKIKALDPSDEFYKEDLEEYLRCLDLGVFIMSHPKFGYDTKEDLEALADEQKTMLNQRSFCEGLNISNGDVNSFKFWIENSSDFLDKNVDMLLTILKTYIVPTFEGLCAGLGIAVSDVAKGEVEAEVTTDSSTSTESDIEDDEDFFKHSMAGKVRVKNPAEVEIAINNAIKEW